MYSALVEAVAQQLPACVPPTDFEASVVGKILSYGVLGIAVIVLGLVVRTLYSSGRADGKEATEAAKVCAAREKELLGEIERQRMKCAAELEEMGTIHDRKLAEVVADFERKRAELSDAYAKQILAMNISSQNREDSIRRDMLAQYREDKTERDKDRNQFVAVMDKFAGRIVTQ